MLNPGPIRSQNMEITNCQLYSRLVTKNCCYSKLNLWHKQCNVVLL